ncbi:hypothetical protein [Saccharopolyspora hattusasensis]|uniref:hypothetical protein n=1 Tax=Saccharopolyspora hattusasensis TaxID=1128679 RepID=UPI003D96AE1D
MSLHCAANRVLDSDAAFAREALAAIADSTRAALADLDNTLGALRSSTLDESYWPISTT